MNNYKKTWYENNKEEIKKQRKFYYENNRDRLMEQFNAYYENNREQISEQRKIYYENNKQKKEIELVMKAKDANMEYILHKPPKPLKNIVQIRLKV